MAHIFKMIISPGIVLEFLKILVFGVVSGIKGQKMVQNDKKLYFYFFNWDSLHARLNSHYKAWSCKKQKQKKVKAYRKSI